MHAVKKVKKISIWQFSYRTDSESVHIYLGASDI